MRSLLPRPVRVVAAVVLVGVFLTGTVALVLDRTAERQAVPSAPVGTDDVAYPGETPGCDGIPDVPECPPYELAEEPTLEGAIERFRNGDLHIYDVVHLMYTEEDYAKALEPYLGPAVLESSYDTPTDGPWARSMEGIDPSESYSRVQQWELTGDSLLLEMVFVLPSTDDVGTLLENHRALLAENGVAPLTGAGLGDGVDAPVAYRFIDGGASLPARRCINRVMYAVGRLVFAVTLATGGDCTNPPVDLPVRIVLGAAQRAEAVLGENPELP